MNTGDSGQRKRKQGFGADVIQLLIPHRRPFLMVDRVESVELEPASRLNSSRYISGNEPVFEGHFPGWAIWPGVYTIEGMGQSCMLLAKLTKICEVVEGEGIGSDEVFGALRDLDMRYHLKPGRRTDKSEKLVELLDQASSRMGLASNIDVKLLHPVFAGQRLDFQVDLTHYVGHVMRFDVEARVDRVPVARGVMGTAYDPSSHSVPPRRG